MSLAKMFSARVRVRTDAVPRHPLLLTPSDFTAELGNALYTLVSLAVALPAYLLLSVALAVAFYIRCAGALLSFG
jgi:hypothetical protein